MSLRPPSPSPETRATRSREVFRRLCLSVTVIAAAAMVVWPASAVWYVRTVDFPALQKQRVAAFSSAVRTVAREAGLPEVPEIRSGAEGEPDAFFTRETRERLESVAGAAWDPFFSEVTATLGGRDRSLARHLEDTFSPRGLYFALTHPPLDELRDRVGDARPFVYLTRPTASEAQYLSLTFKRSSDAMRYAPNAIAFPWRSAAVWVFLAGLAVYCLLPRHRPQPNEFRYRQISAVIVPDILGVLLAAFFAVLPILIIASNASSLRPWSLLDFDDGWGVLTLVMGVMALGGVAMVAMALWHATFSLRAREDHLERVTLLGDARHRFADMERVEPATRTFPRWLRGLMFLAALLRPNMAGTMLIGANAASHGIRIRCRDGRSFNVWFDGFEHPLRLLRLLAKHRVPFSPEFLQTDWEEEEEPDSPPAAPRSRSPAAFVAFAILGGGALTLALWPATPRRVLPPTPSISPAVHAQQSAVLAEMEEVQRQMRAVTPRVDTGDPVARAAAAKEFSVLMGRFQELQARYDELDRRKYEPAESP